MAQWRIRVAVPDGPDGHRVLSSALARIPATQVRLADSGLGAEPGEFVVDLLTDDALGDLLRTLHEISPQVLISRVRPAEADSPSRTTRARRLRRVASVPG